MFKYYLKFNLLFGFLFLGVFLVTGINWPLFYFSFFLFSALGTGLGYHRILGHGLIVWVPVRWLSVGLGALAHLGSPRGSAMWHVNHHENADTKYDQIKTWISLLTPRVEKLRVDKKILKDIFKDLDKDAFFRFLDKYFYIYFILVYLIFYLSFGFKNTFSYVVAPASLALFMHSVSAIFLHGRTKGYRNFNTDDKSINSLLFLPVMFGENWHNNHHYLKDTMNNHYRWWEVDVIYLISVPFKRSDFRW